MKPTPKKPTKKATPTKSVSHPAADEFLRRAFAELPDKARVLRDAEKLFPDVTPAYLKQVLRSL